MQQEGGGGGGQAAAFDLVAFWLYMIAQVKKSVNHLRIYREHVWK